MVAQAGAEATNGGLVREGRFRTEVSNPHRFLQRQRAGHHLAIDRAQGFVGNRAFVEPPDALQHGQLAVRRVNLLARFEFDLADLQDMLGAFIQELYDLRIQPVDRLAVLRDVHADSRSSVARFPLFAGAAAGGGPSDAGAPLWGGSSAGCSGGAAGKPGSTVNDGSGFCTGMRRSSSAAGKSSRLRNPKYSRNRGVVP